MRLAVCLSVLGSLVGWASLAGAQCEEEPRPRDEVRSVARRHYARGVEASTAGRWDEAREAFQRAHDVAAFTPILYNLASSQVETGHLVEATENYRRFLRRCDSERNPELRADAQQLLGQLEARIPRVTLAIDGLDPSTDEILLDDRPLVSAVLGSELPVNPGQHEVRVVREGQGQVAVGGFHVEERESLTLELSAESGGAATTAGAAATSAPAEGGGFDATPAWIVFGASLAVAAGGGVMLGIGQADASAVENAEDGTPWTDVADAASRADLLRNAGWVTMGVGLAGAVLGLTWVLIGESEGGGAAATLRVGPGGATVRGRF